MADKQDSNQTGLRIAEETSLGTVGALQVWYPYEPNSYADFGGQVTNIARTPINQSRQNQKGVPTDLDASGGFNQDWVQSNLRSILQGFFFADWREQPNQDVSSVSGAGVTNDYNVSDETGFQPGNLVLGRGLGTANNNGLKTVDTVAAGVVSVVETLVDEAGPPSGAGIVVVGFEGVTGDIDVDVPGAPALPAYTSTALDFTTLGLFPGVWIYVGGDVANSFFPVNAENNSWKRVNSITAGRLEIDHGGENMVTESGAAEAIQLFTPSTLKNESDPTLIKRRSYQLERTLGDDGSGIQSEYLVGAIANQFQWNVQGQDKINNDLTFVALDEEARTGAEGVKLGGRPALVSEDAFNTSSDFSRIKLTRESTGLALFAYVTEFTLSIDNGVTPNKAVSVLGAFDTSAGNFSVSGSITAYFADVTAKQVVRANEDVAFDFIVAKNNAGWAFDVPLITLGDGRLNVVADEPITIPLTLEAGADRQFDHTLLLNDWPYLPTVAE